MKINIPIVDIATLVTGFYVGYNHAKGNDMSAFMEYGGLIGPTITTAALAYGMTKLAKGMGKMAKTARKYGTIKVNFDGIEKKYSELRLEEREKFDKKISELERKTEELNPRKSAFNAAKRYAIETGIGYVAGQIIGQLTN